MVRGFWPNILAILVLVAIKIKTMLWQLWWYGNWIKSRPYLPQKRLASDEMLFSFHSSPFFQHLTFLIIKLHISSESWPECLALEKGQWLIQAKHNMAGLRQFQIIFRFNCEKGLLLANLLCIHTSYRWPKETSCCFHQHRKQRSLHLTLFWKNTHG